MDKHRCNCCGQPATKECSGCGLEVYCGVECQKEAWPAHSDICDKEVQTVDARFGRRSQRSIPTYLESTREFRPFYDALERNGLLPLVTGRTKVTVFAPTKAAMSNFKNNESLNPLDRPLESILKYHIVPGEYTKKDLREGTQLPTEEGSDVPVSYNAKTGAIMVGYGGAEVTRTDIKVKNGIIHRIDQVLVPRGTT